MGITEIIKQLCQKKDISVSKLEEDLGFGQNTIYQWKKERLPLNVYKKWLTTSKSR